MEKAHLFVRFGPEKTLGASTHLPSARAVREAASGCRVRLGNIPGGKPLSRTLFYGWRTQIPVVM